jgi:hypothetical protein
VASTTKDTKEVDPMILERRVETVWTPSTAPIEPRRRPPTSAYVLGGTIALLMLVASLAGLLVDGLYRDGPWAREALRGGDLTTLALAVPVLVGSLVVARRGSRTAQAVWMGALAYGVYDYAYYSFGARFNDVFVVHMALLVLSSVAFIQAALTFDLAGIAARVLGRAARWIGGFLILNGVVLGTLWVVLSIRFALTGELMGELPEAGVHTVFAVDTTLLAPALVAAGVLMWRGTVPGLALGAAVTVMGALYQANLVAANVFQAIADVPGVKLLPPDAVALALAFVVATAVLFGRRTGRAR